MNHFSIALGIIIVTVIGGAVVLDRATSGPEDAPRTVAAASSNAGTPTSPPGDMAAMRPGEDTTIAMAGAPGSNGGTRDDSREDTASEDTAKKPASTKGSRTPAGAAAPSRSDSAGGDATS